MTTFTKSSRLAFCGFIETLIFLSNLILFRFIVNNYLKSSLGSIILYEKLKMTDLKGK